MSEETILVDGVRQLGRYARDRAGVQRKGAREPIRVQFASGASAQLDATNREHLVWAEVLESLRETRQPAYVEIDPKTRFITSLLLPLIFHVTGIRAGPDSKDLEVELEISHARHWLRRDHPRFDEMREVLERARREKTPVLVSESLDSSAITDVRPAPADGRK
jgi:hypothetical protein